jgi:hypothetical protein
MKDTGYHLTAAETDKFKILVRKSTDTLLEHIRYFPQSGSYDSAYYRQTAEGLNLFIPHWLEEQKDYRKVRKLVNAIGRSSQFLADVNTEAALGQTLARMQKEFENPEVRAKFLKDNAHAFRPKAVVEAELKTVLDFLLPGKLQPAEMQQATDLMAARHRTIAYAGLTAAGEIYVITKSTESTGGDSVYFGAPGALKPLHVTACSNAMDGSDEWINTQEGVQFYFERGGLGNHNDKSKWKASVNDVPVSLEFPTDTLE